MSSLPLERVRGARRGSAPGALGARTGLLATVIALVCSSGCGAEDDKPRLNPQPELPTRPVEPSSANLGNKQAQGGAANTSDALQRGRSDAKRDAARLRAQRAALSDALGEAGTANEDPSQP